MRKLLTFIFVLLLCGVVVATPIGQNRFANIGAVAGNSFVQFDTGLNVGVDDTGYDATFFGATSGDYALFDNSEDELIFVSGYDAQWDDSGLIRLGSATNGDVTMQFDGTNFEVLAAAADTPFALGGTSAGFDYTYYFETAGRIFTDYDGDFRTYTDDMDLRFGTGAGTNNGDFQISSNSSNVLNIAQVVADTGTMTIGADGTDIPLTWYAETAGDSVLFTGDDLQLEDVSLVLAESTQIQFGDPVGTGDLTLSAASNVLTFGQVVSGTGEIAIGVDNKGLDVTFYGETSGDYIKYDQDLATNGGLVFEDNVLRMQNDTAAQWGQGPDASITYDETTDDAWEFLCDSNSITFVMDDILFTTDNTAANQFKVDATGAIAGYAIVLETTDGGIQLNADGATGGDIAVDAADNLTLTAAGDLIAAVTGSFNLNMTGTLNIGRESSTGADANFASATDGDYMLWDASDKALEFVGSDLNLDTDSAIIMSSIVLADSTPQDLDAGDSGKTHVIVDLSQNSRFDLPTEAAGLHYRFIYCGGAAEAHDHTIDAENDLNYFIGGVGFLDNNAGPAALEVSSVYSDGDSNSKFTINNAAGGTVIEMWCDGTNWYISGTVYSDTAPAFADQ